MQQDKVAFSLRENILKKLPEDIQKKVCVAGGAVRDKILEVEIKDYDLFVDSLETEVALMKHLKEKGKEGNINAQTANYTFEGKWLQVVRGKYWSMEDSSVIDDFDFVHCCAMVTMDSFRVHPEFYRSISTKHIMVNKLKFPLNSLERIVKYAKKGYIPCNGTLLALAKAINDMDKKVFSPSEDDEKDGTELNSLLFYSDGTPRFMGVD